ncbi:RNA-binding S4 domain-containing protein [Seohaeicola zhoushanensis]|uniref:RNA-binding protein S4 n=1 Tax=Seohaeicola zhoushanensis TaxID=1569283 RepID=A0A8J3GWZ0_9RHOB|nr:RNA-binding S4 domain-containing protein [Seohaeicola zhoushanensis]GHF51147.1 RNA-binding protein S4 [Seohaeicola zhoushanensis]
MADPAAKLRIDKWLWFARFFKTRTLAAKQVGAGHVRLNGERIAKPAETVVAGDVLTFAQGSRIRVIRVLATGERRGPAPEAQALYEDLTPADSAEETAERAGARPTKRDRRAIDALKPDLSDD